MPSSSKAKGNRFESEIASYFTKWWGRSQFKRMPSSGALRWQGKIWTFGDLLVPEDFNALVECKHYKIVSTDAILHSGLESYQMHWWTQQCLKDAKRASEQLEKSIHPLLIWRMNKGKCRIVMSLPLFESCSKRIYLKHITVYYPGYTPFTILLLKEFFEGVSPQVFKQMLDSVDARQHY
jgi:hypothetical protein